jgi:NAD(P)-dependent dehydrogenase (short-subunit alcohol dehydrogenase family)
MMDSTRFEGYGVLVTGGARGIGAATAHRFGREGARVLIADQDPVQAERTAQALRDEGLTAEGRACDVADRGAVEAVVAHAVDLLGSRGRSTSTSP